MQWSYPFWLFNKLNLVSSYCWKLSLNETVTLSGAWTYPADNYIYCVDKKGKKEKKKKNKEKNEIFDNSDLSHM